MPPPYNPVGRCIYCGSDGSDHGLGREHIIARSLGGSFILPKASCRQCEGITSYIDGVCGRQLFIVARVKYGLPIKTRKKRPSTFPVIADWGTHKTHERLRAAAHPFILAMPEFGEPPSLLTGEHDRQDWGSRTVFVYTEGRPNLPGAKSVGVKTHLNDRIICRMLSKVALAYCVAEHGIDSFKSIVSDFIIEDRSLAPYFVGRADQRPPATNIPTHTLDTYFLRYPQHTLLCANARPYQ